MEKDINRRLTIHPEANKSELLDNVRAAKSILRYFPNTKIYIRGHILKEGVKNPEYLINGLIGDRKGIRSSKGVTAGFKKAIVQKCTVVVIDLDMHQVKNKCTQLAKYIHWRHADFNNGNIISCYVVKNDSAVLITAAEIEKGEEAIISEFKKMDLQS